MLLHIVERYVDISFISKGMIISREIFTKLSWTRLLQLCLKANIVDRYVDISKMG